MEKTATISARIYRSQLKDIEKLAREKGMDRSDLIRRLLDSGLREEKISGAIEFVRLRRITVWRAAEICGVSYREMLDLLKMHNVAFPLSAEDLRQELGELLESDK